MKNIRLGMTEITVPQNAFGALPIQRVSTEEAVSLLRNAYDGGMRFFDTARAYSDSEEKIGKALCGMREKVFISSKTMATTKEKFEEDLDTTLTNLKTDYLDLYQLHCAAKCYTEEDEIYNCLVEAKRQGRIRHIGITAHKIGVAEDIVKSGLYETLQFPFSYLASDRDIALVKSCKEHDMGFIAMKGLSGGLLTDSKACMAFMSQFDALPIWGIQRQSELDEWLSYFDNEVSMTEEIRAFIDKDRNELLGEFCRGCGYCMPCPVGIEINSCARMALMLRRAPTKSWVSEAWQEKMNLIDSCLHCNSCASKCPYHLDTPTLLQENLKDYRAVLAAGGDPSKVPFKGL